MNSRIRLSATLITASVAAISCQNQNDNSKPNILLIVLDDAGYNDFGFMGSVDIDSPNIDALADDGVIFTDAHTSASVSGPSRAGILSGRYQQRNGYECNLEPEFGLDTCITTIGDIFSHAGYQSIAIGKWHQGSEEYHHPNKRGFEEFYGFLTGSRSFFANPNDDAPTAHEKMLQHNGEQIIPTKYMTYQLAEKAEEYIRNSGERPFMMYLAFNAVHTPIEATQEDLNRFDGHPRQMLAAMTYAVDKAIGGIVETLKQEGKYDNTIIFFLSDNGGAHNNQSSNYPLKGWKGNKFEGGHRVPFLMVYGDKIPQGVRYDGLTSSLDILSTTLAAANIEYDDIEAPLDGVNLIPYLNAEVEGKPHQALFWRKNNHKAIRQGDYKLIEVNGIGHRLYNMRESLSESEDLSQSNPELTQKLLKQLHGWESELVNPVLWNEGVWDPVNIEIHRALMCNENKFYYSPEEYNERKR